MRWADGTLRCTFTGNRVDAICGTSDAAPAAIRIDGRKPSESAELYGLPNVRHTLELSGSEETPITALRVYRPPLREEPITRSQSQ